MYIAELPRIAEQHVPLKTRIGSEAFRLEYNSTTPERALRNDIISYLGEYRFQIEKYGFNLLYSRGTDGKLCIRDTDQGESMVLKGQRGIKDKQALGEPVHKYVADLLGMQRLEEQIANAKNGDTIIYGSPPDPEIGYTYGFMYVGHVEQLEGGERKLKMVAVRLDQNPTLDQYNKAISLITGEETHFTSPNEFVATPIVISKHVTQPTIDFVLKGIFDFKIDEKKQQIFRDVITTLDPFITDFIHQLKNGVSATERQIAFNSIENYAIHLRELKENQITSSNYDLPPLRRTSPVHIDMPSSNVAGIRLGNLAHQFGHEPPKAAGSCGSSSSKTSSDIFGTGSIFGSLGKNILSNSNSLGESELFTCPNCSQSFKPPVGDSCPGCHYTKQQFANDHPELACA